MKWISKSQVQLLSNRGFASVLKKSLALDFKNLQFGLGVQSNVQWKGNLLTTH